MNNICPYCEKDLLKEVKRKANCPYCNKVFFVRNGNLLTEREKEICDWQKYMEFLVPDIARIRLDVEGQLTKRFGKEPSAHDLIWGMFNAIVPKLRKESDLSIIYENMATFLDSENKTEQAIQLRKKSLKMTILDFKTSPFTHNLEIVNYNDGFVCAKCKRINNKTMTLDEAYQNPPIPVSTCSNKKCRCSVSYMLE